MHPAGVWSGHGHMEKTLSKNQPQFTTISRDWAQTSQSINNLGGASNLLKLQLLRIASIKLFLFFFYKDCFFSPLILLFMFIDGLLTVRMGSLQVISQKKEKNLSSSCCLCPPYRPVGKEDEHWKKSRCVWEAVFPPWCWVEPVIALDNVCAKLNFVYILSVFTRISSLILRTFSVLLSTIMVILILERSSAEPQSIDHYKSTAWALQKPLTCQGMWSWVYVCVGVCACAQSQTARVRAVQLQ